MKISIKTLALLAVLLLPFTLAAQEKETTLDEFCEKEADRLAQLLNLEDWQTFYVDSTLKHDFGQMQAEADAMNKAKVSNAELYQRVNDKWMAQIDKTYEKIFTKEQWEKFLKMGEGKKIKAREKRMAKYEKAE